MICERLTCPRRFDLGAHRKSRDRKGASYRHCWMSLAAPRTFRRLVRWPLQPPRGTACRNLTGVKRTPIPGRDRGTFPIKTSAMRLLLVLRGSGADGTAGIAFHVPSAGAPETLPSMGGGVRVALQLRSIELAGGVLEALGLRARGVGRVVVDSRIKAHEQRPGGGGRGPRGRRNSPPHLGVGRARSG